MQSWERDHVKGGGDSRISWLMILKAFEKSNNANTVTLPSIVPVFISPMTLRSAEEALWSGLI